MFKIHQKRSPWEVKTKHGTKSVGTSADLNYNHYLPHFSHACNVEKPQNLMNSGTKSHKKSMPGACLRKTHQKVSLFIEKCSKWAPSWTLKSSKIDANGLEVLIQPTFLGTRVQRVRRGTPEVSYETGLAPKMLPKCSKYDVKCMKNTYQNYNQKHKITNPGDDVLY